MPGTSLLKNDKGVVLLVTLAAVSILVATALALNRQTRAGVATTAALRDRLTLRYMAESGVSAAMAMLVKDKKESDADSLQEDWANPSKIDRILGDMPFERGEVSVSISDELARLQVNALVRFPDGKEFDPAQLAVWDRFLKGFVTVLDERGEIDRNEIINSLKDWLDAGDGDAITGLTGAESLHYRNLTPPHDCANGPFNHIDELALVKGISPVLLYGSGDVPGIAEFLTVHGMEDLGEEGFAFPGRININTAREPVLAAMLPEGSEGLASALDDYREVASEGRFVHDLSSPDWAKDVPGAGDLNIDANLTTTRSDFFRIRSSASLDGLEAAVTAVVYRERDGRTGKWKCRVLHWSEE